MQSYIFLVTHKSLKTHTHTHTHRRVGTTRYLECQSQSRSKWKEQSLLLKNPFTAMKRTKPRGPPNFRKPPKHYPPLRWSGAPSSLYANSLSPPMLLCFYGPCHVPHFLMNRLSPATGISPRLHCSVDRGSDGRFRFGFRRNELPVIKRRLRFVIRAELSEAFSPDLGLDSQVTSLILDFLIRFHIWSINLKNRFRLWFHLVC